ncbi:hypothetical protein SEA_ANNADREAMY_181 [Streptomyces phage Annadreamy]|uniref:Uncharacterized protein n=2 Tax=Annadreamyvirus annadreamy TaxID=2846392 RepID=A0A345GTJ4_9CAUD|nr:hypothetical protein HWB75_gp097 [Streptomyces phage Annadreamy]AXG66266.1 hypothetical protein SEA_ANNADREAMY_181 [Streptomyces phage Annadreamy]QGH79489.1 hypothetical protein SEA_LIMPID_188 [Streptomyces phage Limpid]
MKVLIVLALLAAFLYLRERNRGIRAARKSRERLEALKKGENYGRWFTIASSLDEERTYYGKVIRWDVPEDPRNVAELYCVEGSNPDGWTPSFLWYKDDLILQ